MGSKLGILRESLFLPNILGLTKNFGQSSLYSFSTKF